MGHADHRDIGDGGMIHQRVLDLGGIDVLAAGDDHVLHPVVDEEEAVPEITRVAGAKPADALFVPAFGIGLVGGLRVGVIRLEVLLAACPDLAHFAVGAIFAAAGVDDAQFHAGERAPGRAQEVGLGAARIVIRGFEQRDGPGGLGEAIDLEQGHARGLHGADEDVLGDGRGAVDDAPQGREIRGVDARGHEQELQHGGDQQGVGDAVLFYKLQDACRVDLAHEHVGAAVVEAHETPTASRDMEERHGDQVDALGIEMPRLGGHAQHAEEIAIGEFDALG